MLELHAIASKKKNGGGRFAIAMTAQENRRFLTGIMRDHQQYYSMLGRVNAETSECSRAADRESIHEGIRLSVGFVELSRMVFGVMEGWMEEQLRCQAAASAAAGCENDSMRWNGALATLLQQQGRSDEAVVLFEACMEYCRRSLPEHDYVRGKMSLCCFTIGFTPSIVGSMMNNLGQVYAKLGRFQDALVMYEKTLECLVHVLPANHPELGATSFWIFFLFFNKIRCFAGAAMSSLACTHNALGRFHDALVLHEKTLEFRRRVLPENHVDISATYICIWGFTCNFTRSVAGESMNNLAFTYGALGRHHDALALQEEVLKCLRHVLPENHPNFGVSRF